MYTFNFTFLSSFFSFPSCVGVSCIPNYLYVSLSLGAGKVKLFISRFIFSVFAILPFILMIDAHLFIPNSILISLEKASVVCSSEYNLITPVVYNFMSST